MIIKEFELKKFPTHVSLTKYKNFKISTQGIYNSKLHYRERSKIIEQMKLFIKSSINKRFSVDNALFPLTLRLIFYVPANWGTVRKTKTGVLKWIPAKDDYIPQHDLDNMCWIWGKTIQDCLKDKSIIPDDTVKYIDEIQYKYIPICDLEERSIIVRLIKE